MWHTGMCFDQQSGPSLHPLGARWVNIEELRMDACTRRKKLFPILIPCKSQWLKILRSARVNDPRKSNQEVSPNQFPWAAVSCQYPLNWSLLVAVSIAGTDNSTVFKGFLIVAVEKDSSPQKFVGMFQDAAQDALWQNSPCKAME